MVNPSSTAKRAGYYLPGFAMRMDRKYPVIECHFGRLIIWQIFASPRSEDRRSVSLCQIEFISTD
jgi:hypothetical protein